MSNPSVATPIANTIKSARSRELLKRGVRTLFLPLAGNRNFKHPEKAEMLTYLH